MKPSLPEISPQYIIDKGGKKTAVIIDIETYEKLLEEIEDIYLGCLSEAALKDESEFKSHAAVVKSIAKSSKAKKKK